MSIKLQKFCHIITSNFLRNIQSDNNKTYVEQEKKNLSKENHFYFDPNQLIAYTIYKQYIINKQKPHQEIKKWLFYFLFYLLLHGPLSFLQPGRLVLKASFSTPLPPSPFPPSSPSISSHFPPSLGSILFVSASCMLSTMQHNTVAHPAQWQLLKKFVQKLFKANLNFRYQGVTDQKK